MCLYNYSIERRAIISNLVSRPLFQNNDLTPHATVFGELGDISYIYTFSYYEWVCYRDLDKFPQKRNI